MVIFPYVLVEVGAPNTPRLLSKHCSYGVNALVLSLQLNCGKLFIDSRVFLISFVAYMYSCIHGTF